MDEVWTKFDQEDGVGGFIQMLEGKSIAGGFLQFECNQP